MTFRIMAKCGYAEYHYAECCYAECRKKILYAECRYAECRGAVLAGMSLLDGICIRTHLEVKTQPRFHLVH